MGKSFVFNTSFYILWVNLHVLKSYSTKKPFNDLPYILNILTGHHCRQNQVSNFSILIFFLSLRN